MYLWVDITGCKFIDGDTKKVQWHAAYNEITAWAVEHDEFKVKLLGRKGKLKERTFMTGYDKATQLKGALEEQVKLYLQQPELVQQLQKMAYDLPVGSVCPYEALAQVPPFGTGHFIDQSNAVAQTKRRWSIGGGRSNTPKHYNPPPPPPPGQVPDDGAAPWEKAANMRGFNCQLVEQGPGGVAAARDVVLIVKDDGLHILRAGGHGASDKQVVFFGFESITKTRVMDGEFRFVVDLDGTAATYRFMTSEGQAIENEVNAKTGKGKAQEAASSGARASGSSGGGGGGMARNPAMDMFEALNDDDDSDVEGGGGGSFPPGALGDRVRELKSLMDSCMTEARAVDSEEALLSVTMDFMERVNEFVLEGAGSDEDEDGEDSD